MREEGPTRLDDEEHAIPGESFLQRFHRRKLESRQPHSGDRSLAEQSTSGDLAHAEPAAPELTDADMPPLESLTVDSDYSGFLSAKVSESLRRAALRKLFLSEQFNVIDELDDYAEDFTTFTALGDVITADMRHRLEVEARRQAEALKDALLEDETAADEQAPSDTDRVAGEPSQPTISDGQVPPGEAEHT